jgi:hypothetical protein
MGNHFHLVVETPHANLVEGMRWLLSTYANRFNHRRKKTGHLFSGRYKAFPVEAQMPRPLHCFTIIPHKTGFAINIDFPGRSF